MFEPRISLLEIVLRVLLIYLFLLVAMRLFGKKEMGRWREMLTEQQLLAALRREHVESPEEVSRAYIESDGKITIIPRRKAVSSASSG